MLIDSAFARLDDHITGRGDPAVHRGERPGGLTLDAALFAPPGGYRSILGTLKHIGGWGHVYHSYAFDDRPTHWDETGWPRGLRDTIDPSADYLAEIVRWVGAARDRWLGSLSGLGDEVLESVRPLHWRAEAPLMDIAMMVASHVTYHTGEINQLLSIHRGEAWEEGEEVEENHLPSDGHRVIPLWRSAT